MCRCEVAIACPLDSAARDIYVQVLSHPLRDDAAAGQKTTLLNHPPHGISGCNTSVVGLYLMK